MTFADLMAMFVEDYCRKKGVESLPDFTSEEWHLLLWKVKRDHPEFSNIIGEFDERSSDVPVNANLIDATLALQSLYKPNIKNRIVLDKDHRYNHRYVGEPKIYQEICEEMFNYLNLLQ